MDICASVLYVIVYVYICTYVCTHAFCIYVCMDVCIKINACVCYIWNGMEYIYLCMIWYGMYVCMYMYVCRGCNLFSIPSQFTIPISEITTHCWCVGVCMCMCVHIRLRVIKQTFSLFFKPISLIKLSCFNSVGQCISYINRTKILLFFYTRKNGMAVHW